MTTYTTYENFGSMPLWEQNMRLFPWLSEDDARRIARDGIRALARYSRSEAHRIKP